MDLTGGVPWWQKSGEVGFRSSDRTAWKGKPCCIGRFRSTVVGDLTVGENKQPIDAPVQTRVRFRSCFFFIFLISKFWGIFFELEKLVNFTLEHEHHNLAYELRDLGLREKPGSHISCSWECRRVHNYVLLFLLHGLIVDVLVQMVWINVDMRHDNLRHVNFNAQMFIIKLKHCSKKLWLYICLDDMNFGSR
jgi:hypothetical protein